jgi:predicted transcriptional regulator
VYTPAWWNLGTQFGLLKTISVRREGTFLDGVRISDVTPADLGIEVGRDIVLRIENGESAVHAGGISLFGRKFGNYDQDIEVTIVYE